jgi:hypothetical protein
LMTLTDCWRAAVATRRSALEGPVEAGTVTVLAGAVTVLTVDVAAAARGESLPSCGQDQRRCEGGKERQRSPSSPNPPMGSLSTPA